MTNGHPHTLRTRPRRPRTGRRGRLPAVALALPAVLVSSALSLAPAQAAAPGLEDPTGADATSSAPAASTAQPVIDARAKGALSVDGLVFKDSDGSGTLTPYEDWRLPAEERARDLAQRMTLEERAGMMLIDTLNAQCDPTTGERGVMDETAEEYIGEQKMNRFVFRNTVTTPDEAVCAQDGEGISAGTTLTPGETAGFMNRVQHRSEATRLGVPALFKSNARNHIDPDARAGINESVGAMTAFPKEAGLASAVLGEQATGGAHGATLPAIDAFTGVMGDEWSAMGIRGMYGYMADLSTEPRWYRAHETFTEDAELNAQIVSSLVRGLQGPVDSEGASLTPESDVALTMKHFPGGGPQELGYDPHYSFGKTQVYPGGAFEGHLLPFEAAIDAGVSSIMPYYGVPMDVTHNGTDYDETGFAFSDQITNGLLRDEMGFRGYVNSDTGIINDRAWGLEDLSVPERVAAAINGGTDTLSGFHDAATITDLVDDGLVTEERVTEAAQRLLTPMFEMGLFENPYSDPQHADATVGSEASAEVGLDLQRRSAVLLQNEAREDGGKALPLEQGSSVYLLGDIDAQTVRDYGYDVIDGNTEDPAQRPSAAGADHVVINVTSNNVNTEDYRSDDPATGMNPEHTNPIAMPGVEGLDGRSPFGAADACSTQGAEECTDDTLRFGGALPWEVSALDFTSMEEAQSWEVTPSLEQIQEVMAEVDDPSKVILNIYFRQPYALDEASGMREAGAIMANFGMSDEALMDVLSGRSSPQGRMPFALPASREAVEQQYSDLPGYEETEDGELFGFGHGLTY